MNKTRKFSAGVGLALMAAVCAMLAACERPHERIVLRDIRDVVVDANTDPMLRANAVFYNPNDMHGKLRKIDVVIFVNGKRAAHVDQRLRTEIPAKGEFRVPLEVKLSIKELGFMDTLLGVLGGKKFEVRYEGKLKLSYKGIPFSVPINYKDEVRVNF
jgi:LEA14-like dessication related protein